MPSKLYGQFVIELVKRGALEWLYVKYAKCVGYINKGSLVVIAPTISSPCNIA